MVSAQLVTILANESRKKPEKLKNLRDHNLKSQRKRDAIEHTVSNLLERNKPIFSIDQVQREVQTDTLLETDRKLVSRVMRKEMTLGYRMAKTVTI